MTSVFMDSIHGPESKVGGGRSSEREDRAKSSASY